MVIRTALVGLGSIAPYHLRALIGNKDYQLTTVMDASPAKVSQFKEKYLQGTDMQTTSKLDFLDKKDIDLVVLATPPSTHYNLAIKSMNHGKNVICEKPIATSLKQAETMLSESTKKHLILYPAYHAAFNPITLAAVEKLKGQEIKSVNIVYRECVRNYHPESSWLFDPAISGGGCLADSGINAFSIAFSILGGERKDVRINDAELRYEKGIKVETGASVSLDVKGVPIRLEQEWTIPKDAKETRKVTFMTSSGNYTVDIVDKKLSLEDMG
ncbi:Gfo/Idh/MocA family oxidoreductase, partial [archaeon]